METIGQRVKRLRVEKQLSQENLARLARVTQGTISQQEDIPTRKSKHLPVIAMALGTTAEYLITGRNRPADEGLVTDDEFVEISLLDNKLGAGGGAIMEDYDLVNCKLAYRRDWLMKRGLIAEKLGILPVKGSSMIPYLFDGNKAVIDTADKRIVDGEHYAIRVGDEAKVKRLFKQPDGKIRVESYNASTEFIGPGDDAEVLGHVVDRKGA